MSRLPSYPDDAAVGANPDPGAGDQPGAGGKPAESKRTKHLVTGAAIGIGSAAIVAALLYANYGKKGGKG
jgi:hypothetical protein